MAEITSIREIKVNKEIIKIEINEVIDNIKFIDKYGYFKVYRKEFKKIY